jgi:hypothetical protein
MAEKDKVINGLRCCAHTDGINCMHCPYDNKDEDCTALMSIDAIALLKEQEAEIRQLKLALDIAKGTCKGIKVEGR